MADGDDVRLDALLAALLPRCPFPPPGTALRCGVSGGADSLALLVLAAGAGCVVTAVHVDHGLRPGSHTEAEFVRDVAHRFGAGFEAHTVEIADGPNLEARARAARHEALGPDAALGHTADDQAETMLLALLRGSGLDGLTGMAGGARRPILDLRRSETEAVCRAAGLAPFQDPSNRDPRFVRNRVRRDVIPLLNDVASRDVVPLLHRAAGHLAAEAEVLDQLAAAVDPTDSRALAAAPPALAARAVRRWLAADGPGGTERHPPSTAAVARVLAVARHEATACELAGGWRVARTGGRLRLAPPEGTGVDR